MSGEDSIAGSPGSVEVAGKELVCVKRCGMLTLACFLPCRYMAVVAFANECFADVIGVVAASSDATLRHLSFDLKSRRQASYFHASLYFVMNPPQECKMSVSGAVMCAGGSMWQICATTPRQS